MLRLSISGWSLRRLLGEIVLIDVPGETSRHGIGTIKLCHFHFRSTDDVYLAELKNAVVKVGVELFSILIDTGDITVGMGKRGPTITRRSEDGSISQRSSVPVTSGSSQVMRTLTSRPVVCLSKGSPHWPRM